MNLLRNMKVFGAVSETIQLCQIRPLHGQMFHGQEPPLASILEVYQVQIPPFFLLLEVEPICFEVRLSCVLLVSGLIYPTLNMYVHERVHRGLPVTFLGYII